MNPDAKRQIPAEYLSHAEQVRETYREQGRQQERSRLLSLKNEIINSVVDYTLTPAQYDQTVARLTEIITGKTK